MGAKMQGRTILVAEDMPALREPMAVALRHEGYRVLTCANGREALSLVEQEKPDLLLLDLAMPVMDGVTCLRQIRQFYSRRELPVIVLTAHSEQSLVARVAELGVDDFYLKSAFTLQGLFEKVAAVLGEPAGSGRTVGEDGPSPSGETSSQAAGVMASAGEPVTPARTQAVPGAAELRFRQIHGDEPGRRFLSRADKSIREAAEFVPLLSREALEARLRTFDAVKGFSPAVANLLRTIDSPVATLDQIVDAASLDQALATRFLWLANSAAYARGDEVRSLRKAIVRIGTEKLREAALTIGVMERFSSDADEYVHYGRFWEHSITVASLAAELARAAGSAGDLEPDLAFTIGLVHDIGRLILLECLGDLYGEVLARAREEGLPLEELERRLLLTSHTQVAESALRKWRFSARVIRPVTLHHLGVQEIRRLVGPDRIPCTILALADGLGKALLLGDSGEDHIEEVCPLIDDLGLGAEIVPRILQQIIERWRDLRTVVIMKSWREWPDRITVLKRLVPEGVRPGWLDYGNYATLRLLFSRLFPAVEDSRVTAWIVRVDSRVHLEAALRDLQQRERAGQMGIPRPVLLLAGGELDVPWQGDREIRTVRAPFCIESVLRKLAGLVTPHPN